MDPSGGVSKEDLLTRLKHKKAKANRQAGPTDNTRPEKRRKTDADNTHQLGTSDYNDLTHHEASPTEDTSHSEAVSGSGGAAMSSAESFEELGVCPELCEACRALGWVRPTKIQVKAIPWALKGRDIIGLAETGSGKTGAFALPILQSLLDQPQRVYGVVLAPTRELCVQIAEQFQALGASIALEVAVVVGGLDMVTQAMALSRKPHIIVASPGRLVDHLENTKGFHIRCIKYLVMDEADRLLSMDFEEPLNKIIQAASGDRRTYLFSATMTSKVSKLQRASLTKPVKVEVSTKYETVSTLVQSYMFIPFKYKHTYLVALLKHLEAYVTMVFAATCLGAQRTALLLRKLAFPAICLHGKMSQSQRLGALNHFKSGAKKVLVVTEVGSRGLDIPSVDVVVNMDIPTASKDYIHRVGRTARAGRTGRAITLVTQYDIEPFQRIEHALGHKLEETTEVHEDMAMAHHERVLEALREVDSEMHSTSSGSGSGKPAHKSRKKRHQKGGAK
ncbi:unnamed protein product [Vitrella brassicaformis CCMP3155]|uniref:RNA helicase n=2 Tax=Vitrella brassicaformis TaxID=1169539 RepID=A0A0G4EYV3_VITBC|nr:unnamed protein product [Vitrella brassicaformis CCMP3155]|eukprot:CEM03635.1 unnamed protein product [Vitrella brassicaformis CCMP3155]